MGMYTVSDFAIKRS